MHKPLLLTLGLGVFAGALDLGVLAPALPALARAFHVTLADLSWVFTLYLLVNVGAIAVATTLADRYGRRRIYILSVAIFAAGSIITILSHAYPYFLFGRALQAFGAGGLFPVATAVIGDVVPQERRGAALGAVAATWGIAAVIGPILGGALTHALSWQWIFVANVPLALVVIWLAMRYMPARTPIVHKSFDLIGLTLLCAGLLGVVYGIVAMEPIAGIAGVIVLVGFVLRERVAPNPIVPMPLLTTPQLTKTYALELLIGVLEGSLFFIPAIVVVEQHVTTAVAGLVASLGAATFVVVIPISGRALDRTGARPVLLMGTVLTALGLIIFAYGFSSLGLTLLAMVVAGTGFGALLGAPTRYIVTTATIATTRATAVGLLSQSLIIGQILGTALVGGILGLVQSENAGYRDAYLAFCAVALGALALVCMLKATPAGESFHSGHERSGAEQSRR